MTFSWRTLIGLPGWLLIAVVRGYQIVLSLLLGAFFRIDARRQSDLHNAPGADALGGIRRQICATLLTFLFFGHRTASFLLLCCTIYLSKKADMLQRIYSFSPHNTR